MESVTISILVIFKESRHCYSGKGISETIVGGFKEPESEEIAEGQGREEAHKNDGL